MRDDDTEKATFTVRPDAVVERYLVLRKMAADTGWTNELRRQVADESAGFIAAVKILCGNKVATELITRGDVEEAVVVQSREDETAIALTEYPHPEGL